MFLNGTAMSGQKDYGAHDGSIFLGPAKTSSRYRFFAIRDEFPGLLPVDRAGRAIVGELYDIPDAILHGSLLPAEPAELELGEVELEDGEVVTTMILQPNRLKAGEKIVDISEIGDFRTYQAFLRANVDVGLVLGRNDIGPIPILPL